MAGIPTEIEDIVNEMHHRILTCIVWLLIYFWYLINARRMEHTTYLKKKIPLDISNASLPHSSSTLTEYDACFIHIIYKITNVYMF
jgi:hypothetical protein